MNKRFLILTILLCGLIFSACGKGNENNNNENIDLEEYGKEDNSILNGNQQEDPETAPAEAITYYETETVNLICPGENGAIYIYSRKGKKICEYNAEGECVKEYPLKEKDIYSISYLNGILYYINSGQLYTMDLETGTSEAIYTFDGDRFFFGRMVALEDSLYILRKEQYKEEWADVRFEDEDGYTYEGEELLCFHLSTGEMEALDISNIKQINKKSNGELLIYAYDEEGGFYFTVYHTDGTLEEKRYTGIKFGTVNDIAYDEDFDRIVCNDFTGIFLTKLDDLSGKAYAYENISIGYNTLTCVEGFTYDLFTIERKDFLVRLQNRLLVRDTPTLKGYTLNSFYNPKRYGYPIDCEKVTEEEMAMALLAGDSDYDFLILDSDWQIARNIQRLGAYYPLNSLNGLNALLEDSHSYVREAATVKNGDLWMLPLNVECPILFYNENLIKEYGITLEHLSTYTELIERTIKLPNDGSILYSLLYYLMTSDITNQYLGNYAIENNRADFHKDIFRTYLDIMRKFDEKEDRGDILFNTRSLYPYTTMDKEYYTNMLFAMERSTIADGGPGFRYDKYEFIHALPAPSLLEKEKFKNQAMVRLIVINPNSEKLKSVLEYMNEVCEGIRKDEYSLMLKTNDFSDKPLWQEMQAILADAEIYFKYPYEIIVDEMNAYRKKGQSYEDTINEMERKMNMYLNE